mmetsp:Transcript_2589/g.6072  ORF Transcript_2589/g.6072 Transcript_2589/m.6072 type:complete len:292 (-) Transcript_2589:1375-2250(-)
MRRDTECSSMYSLMSTRTSCFSSSNSCAANALLSSVFPTPVGPRNRQVHTGWLGGERPARERRIAADTASTASSWPTTRFPSSSPIERSRWRSEVPRRETGIPVQRETTERISSAPTLSETSPLCSLAPAALDVRFASSCSSGGSMSYLSSATRSRLYRRSSSAMLRLICSISVRRCWTLLIRFRSWSYPAFNGPRLPSILAISCWISSIFCFVPASPCTSLPRPRSSISSWSRRRCKRSISSGWESSCTRTIEHASSTRSMALSGRKREVMYLSASSHATTRALSLILTP